MNFISVLAVTEEVAREQAVAKTGYSAHTIGRLIVVGDQGTNSRQKAYIFETTNDVRNHPQYVRRRLSDIAHLTELEADGPVLSFGTEVTVGG